MFLLANLSLNQAFARDSALKNHPSPYLAMHADDPVHWQLWGKDVLDRAKAENKLVYVSIGYFSCHWCHVMQRETYQNSAVGEFLNKNFIAVKVDRELRPELDRRLIRFVEEVRGQAGWPLNVFITADGYPLTGFTYLPRDNFFKVVEQLNEQWLDRNNEISAIAKQYFEQVESSDTSSPLVTLAEEHNSKLVDAFVSQAMAIADELQGGFGTTLKFPSYPQLNALLKIIKADPQIDSDVIDFMHLTLESMASFHLMDHINNGFFRYSTDPDWQTPHFEKMLYDNAQLATLYLDAAIIWPSKGYAEIGLKTIDFMINFLLDDQGGFNASLSAVDENNREGAGYLWSQKELANILSEAEFTHLKRIWTLADGDTEDFQSNPLTGPDNSGKSLKVNQAILHKLQNVKKPVMPVDNKRLASWNALVLTALVKAQGVTSTNNRLKERMLEQYEYISNSFIDKDKEGIAVIRFAGQAKSAETTLEDYSQLAHAIQLYAMETGDKSAHHLVESLVEQAFSRFYRNGRWVGDTESLIPGDTGDLIIQDSVLQSPSSLLLETVFMMEKPDLLILQKAKHLVSRLTRDVLDTPYYYGSSIMLKQVYDSKFANKINP